MNGIVEKRLHDRTRSVATEDGRGKYFTMILQ